MFLFVGDDRSPCFEIIANGNNVALFIVVLDDTCIYSVVYAKTISVYKTAVYSCFSFLFVRGFFWVTCRWTFLDC